ncbi:MAG TPA: Clp protease N-terminal domain-containing protein [Candidatus Limnocylindrales bacterium]|nr:Clp protease N-terminal domain-containing protein [Candidatus Limnocylindrales bacterium]
MSELWVDARSLASDHGQETLTTDILLIALARRPGVAGDVLRSLGASEEALLRAMPPARAKPGAAGTSSAATSPAVEQARGRAEGLALGHGVPVDSTHVLLALAYDDVGMHASALRLIGVDRGAIVEGLRSRGVAVPPVAPPQDMPMKSASISLAPDEARLVIDELVARTTSGDRALIGAGGRSRWGYGGDPADSRRVVIHAEPDVPLASIAASVLESAEDKGG